MIRLLVSACIFALLLGCPLARDGGADSENGSGAEGGAGPGEGGPGGTVITEEQGGSGMSDPSRCNNLPPSEMADCLDQAMGG